MSFRLTSGGSARLSGASGRPVSARTRPPAPTPPPIDGLSVQIVASGMPAENYAPLQMLFRVEGLDGLWGIDDLSLFDVEWNFGEDYAFTAFDTTPEARVGDRRSGTARTIQAGHVYRQPGTYQPTVTIRARGGFETQVTGPEFVVSDPDDFYPGQQTVCVSRDGDFTGAPAGALLVTVSSGNVTTGGWAARNSLANKRVLFKKGQAFNWAPDLRRANTTIGSFGPGDGRAEILNSIKTGTDTTAPNGTHNLKVFGIEMQGGYDALASNEWWLEDTPPPRPLDFSVIAAGSAPVLFDNCRFFGTDKVQGRGVVMTVNDVLVDNYFDFGVFATARLYGVCIKQPIGVPLLGMGSAIASNRTEWNTHYLTGPRTGQPAPNYPRHCPFRTGSRNNVTLSKVFLRTGGGHDNDSWSQPAARLSNSEQTTGAAHILTASEAHFVGGWEVVMMRPVSGATGNHAPARLVHFDRCIMEGDSGTIQLIECPMDGVALTNCLMTSTSPTREPGSSSAARFLRTLPDAVNCRVRNTTMIHTRPMAEVTTQKVTFIPSEWIASNCAHHTNQPGRIDGQSVVNTPLEQFDAEYALLPDSPLAGTASGVVLRTDHAGTVRPGSATPGYLEPTP
jgi:hypothetical protein